MHVFEMVVIVVIAALIAGVLKEYLSKKQTPNIDISGIENRLNKLEVLQERIETLEAIVTDKGYDLKQEIDNLK